MTTRNGKRSCSNLLATTPLSQCSINGDLCPTAPPVPDMNGNATNQEGKPRENGHSEKGGRSHNRGRVLRNAKNLKIYPSGQFTCQGFKIKKRGSYEGPVWRKHAEELGIEGSLGNSLRTL